MLFPLAVKYGKIFSENYLGNTGHPQHHLNLLMSSSRRQRLSHCAPNDNLSKDHSANLIWIDKIFRAKLFIIMTIIFLITANSKKQEDLNYQQLRNLFVNYFLITHSYFSLTFLFYNTHHSLAKLLPIRIKQL